LKLCAGWVTPQAMAALELTPEQYPHSFLTFSRFHVHLFGMHLKAKTLQHSVRRYEFANYLLARSGAPVFNHYVRNVVRHDGRYVIDDAFSCEYLVGAGGTKCPVYKTFFREANPRAKILQTGTLEHEFSYDWSDGDCHLWFFKDKLPGYAWYVPKGEGHLNVGLSGMADKLKSRGGDIKQHWSRFTKLLGDKSFTRNVNFEPTGYSYYVRGDVDTIRVDNAFIVGDAVGLATRDLCEGIGPAIVSGVRAAKGIGEGLDYPLDDVAPLSIDNMVAKKLLELAFT
jgi:flavin-dependent dehydrogenase